MKEAGNFREKKLIWIMTGIVFLYGVACMYLYYHQLFFVEGGRFESDLPFHVRMAVEDHWYYSLTALLYQLFYFTPWGNGLTAFFLAAVSVASVYASACLLHRLTGEKHSYAEMLLFAFTGEFIMPFFLRWAHFQRYIGYESASIWHNSTYICMKLAGILTFSCFLKLRDSYSEGIRSKEWITFAFLLILCNGIKPSFCMIFAPAMAVFLLAELFHGVPFRRVFLFGMAVVPSLVVILWQNVVLFGEDTGNGIVLNPGYALSLRGSHPKVTFILSIAFPLFVLLFSLKELLRDARYRFIWFMWLFGFLEVFLFSEAGSRAKDSNFFWGYSMAVFFVNLASMEKLLTKGRSKDGMFGKKLFRYFFVSAGAICLAYQVWCGLYFFGRLLTGESYWM